MKFAFLVHPISPDADTLMRLDDRGEFRSLWRRRNPLEIGHYLQVWLATQSQRGKEQSRREVAVIDELPDLYSINGTRTEGRLYEIPMSVEEIKDDPTRAVAYMQEAVNMAADWGAGVIGLGSMTGIIGGHGNFLAENCPIPVTTGNSLTVFAALENLNQVCRELHIDLSQQTVTVVGVPGSIATAAAKLLAKRVKKLLLVGRRPTSRALRLAKRLGAELLFEPAAALARSHLALSATSTGGCINQSELLPGSVVIDVGVPADVRGTAPERDDVLFVSGGLASVPDAMSRDSVFLGFHYGIVPSCLAETMNLALEERAECFSLGRELELARIREIGRIAVGNGFDFSRVFSFGQPVEDSAWSRLLKLNTRSQLDRSSHTNLPDKVRLGFGESDRSDSNGNGHDRSASPGGANGNGRNGNTNGEQALSVQEALPREADLVDRATTLFRRHVNPVLVGAAHDGGLTTMFVRGEGNYLWDAKGRKYLDFVAGYGSLNFGHNNPRVVAAVTEALVRHAPGFTQAAVNPYAAALAERLVALTPAGLEMVFFCNSGTESVEAALKLARLSTGRTAFLHCDGSFHGKTLGALSITGNQAYQRPFAPLIQECESVPFGDLESLQRAVRARKFAAFVVEPVQGEGGMITPPHGYLKAAETICREANTLLIVDEVQTGLGRTGAMFACDKTDVAPDMMTLAKSLGGGIMPIGAMLARRDLWQKAYGTLDSFALHTSTFGGGSLACAAGLAALDTLVDESLASNARARGDQLRDGLLRIQAETDGYVVDIRGDGLMLGVELSPLTPSVAAHLKRADSTNMLQFLVGSLDDMISTVPAVFQMQMLLQHFGIYTQVARSNPLVLRIQPPLTITEAQVDSFLDAFGQTCRAGERLESLFDVLITKAIAGHHAYETAAEGTDAPPKDTVDAGTTS